MSLLNPSNHFEAVTPSDSTVLTEFRSLFVGVEGDVTVVNRAGDAITFKNVAGFMPIMGTRVMLTGTDATDIVALY